MYSQKLILSLQYLCSFLLRYLFQTCRSYYWLGSLPNNKIRVVQLKLTYLEAPFAFIRADGAGPFGAAWGSFDRGIALDEDPPVCTIGAEVVVGLVDF